MCGIVGMYSFKNAELLKKMLGAIAHRGPDGEGMYEGALGALGSRRLAVIDLAGGQMPISNEDGTCIIVYNGEIYNHAALSDELKSKGHVYKTKSDTEMVLHAYEEWGPECVKRFNGMFAFAIYDSRSDTIFAARDQFGIKPFYYSELSEGKFIFGSEIKAFLTLPDFVVRPNDQSIYKYLAFRKHDDTKHTFFDGVNKLQPGEYAIFSKQGLRVHSYYTIDLAVRATESDDILINKFKELFLKSVRDRLMSEVPVGTCLSGGLDSSAIVCIANKELKSLGTKRQQTFSATFPNAINNEESYIQEVLQATNAEENFVSPQSKGLFEELGAFVFAQEEPTISSGPYAQWCVMRKAHEKVKVLLDGQGADELLAGYTPYLLVYLKQLFKEGKFMPFVVETFYCFPQLFQLVLAGLKAKITGKYAQTDLIAPGFASKYSESNTISTDNLKKRLHYDLFNESIPALLRYEDKNSMAFSIEGRVPFLDPDLVEFIFSLPDNLLIRNGVSKYILREAVKDLVPEKIYSRRWKVGFTTPEVAWFREQKEQVLAIVNSDSFKSRKYFNHAQVTKFVRAFLEGKHDESMVIWRLINLEMWLRVFVK